MVAITSFMLAGLLASTLALAMPIEISPGVDIEPPSPNEVWDVCDLDCGEIALENLGITSRDVEGAPIMDENVPSRTVRRQDPDPVLPDLLAQESSELEGMKLLPEMLGGRSTTEDTPSRTVERQLIDDPFCDLDCGEEAAEALESMIANGQIP